MKLNNYQPPSSNYLGYNKKVIAVSGITLYWLTLPNATYQPLYTFVFDNNTNHKYGTYLFEYTVRYWSTSGAGTVNFNFDTTSGSGNSTYMTAISSGVLFGTTYYYIVRASFTIQCYFTQTWYFNGAVSIGGTLTFDPNSYVSITRIG